MPGGASSRSSTRICGARLPRRPLSVAQPVEPAQSQGVEFHPEEVTPKAEHRGVRPWPE